jgi:mutator protein MutT
MTIVVCAAVIERDDEFLVTRRLDGTHLAGAWEFPGGKCDAGESLEACLVRELREELAVTCTVGQKLFEATHQYADRRIELHFFACRLQGEPTPQLGQEMRWVARGGLTQLTFPPADDELIRTLTRT